MTAGATDNDGAPLFDWEGAARAHADAQADAEMYAEHEAWLQNSWGGWAVRTVRSVADNSFFHAIADSLNDDGEDGGNNASAILIKNGARLGVILAMILMTLAVGKVLQMIVGQDIVIEQEVIIEEEVQRSELGGNNDNEDGSDAKEEVVHEEESEVGATTKRSRRSSRQRKKEG